MHVFPSGDVKDSGPGVKVSSNDDERDGQSDPDVPRKWTLKDGVKWGPSEISELGLSIRRPGRDEGTSTGGSQGAGGHY